MKFISIKKILDSKFISRYDVLYETEIGTTKNYEMISRSKDITTLEKLQNIPESQYSADAVVIIMHDVSGDKVLLNKEYRMAIGGFVYNFPAGLIDQGEEARISAARELKEETGLDLIEITDVWPMSYSAVGLSNETSIVVIGKASGNFSQSTSADEEIEAGWFSKAEVKELLATENFAARTQAYLQMWIKN